MNILLLVRLCHVRGGNIKANIKINLPVRVLMSMKRELTNLIYWI